MTTTRRITTTAAALLSLAALGAPVAGARPADFVPIGNEAHHSVYSLPDKSMIASGAPATNSGAIGPDAALRSLTQQQRQRVAGLSALSDRQLGAAFGTALPVASQASASQSVVRSHTTPAGEFDWGDAGIGAAGGLTLSLIAFGGGLAVSQRRGRRTGHSTA